MEEYTIEVENAFSKQIKQFVHNTMGLPYRVKKVDYNYEGETVLISLSWFRQDIDISKITSLKKIHEVYIYILDRLIKQKD